MTQALPCVELLVCTRCRRDDGAGDQTVRDQTVRDGAERDGAVLFARLAGSTIEGVTVTPVECLSNCSRGCTIALRGQGRWTYVYGGLEAGKDLETIREGAAKYRAAADGLVPWRARPEHFRKNCIARIPPIA